MYIYVYIHKYVYIYTYMYIYIYITYIYIKVGPFKGAEHIYIYIWYPPKTYLFYICIGIYSILCRLLAGVNKAEKN